jgi:hypothetical protein
MHGEQCQIAHTTILSAWAVSTTDDGYVWIWHQPFTKLLLYSIDLHPKREADMRDDYKILFTYVFIIMLYLVVSAYSKETPLDANGNDTCAADLYVPTKYYQSVTGYRGQLELILDILKAFAIHPSVVDEKHDLCELRRNRN